MRVETGGNRQIFRGTLRRIEALELDMADTWERYETISALRPSTTEERLMASEMACVLIRKHNRLARRKTAIQREFRQVIARKTGRGAA
jgi:hypothetical protein